LFLPAQYLHAQGKFAGSYRSLIGKTYQDKSQLPLTGFTLQGGTLLENLSMTWYSKGNLAVVLFEEISKNGYSVRDVIEISNFSKDQSVRFGNCLNSRLIEDGSIVALVKLATNELLNATNAWRWIDETKSLESISVNEINGISCPNESLSLSNMATPVWKPYVNKIFKDTKEIPALKDYTMKESSSLSPKTGVTTFGKGKNIVIVFELVLEDNYRFVVDIVETTLTETQDIRIGLCKNGTFDAPGVVAVVEQSKAERWKAVKAWNCDSYQIAVKDLPAKDVTCLGNYGEN
jgi:hypothetical protein